MRTPKARSALRVLLLGALVSVMVCGAAPSASARTNVERITPEGTSTGETIWYLALGDSLAAGFQPNQGLSGKGYVDNLAGRVREHLPSLQVRNVGCPGETSKSMITGVRSPCQYSAGSQLDAAVAFLKAHPDRVGFITIDIGANDLFKRCLHPRQGLIDEECAAEQSPRMQARLEQILGTLGEAAGSQVPIVGMNYYNPFLGFWGNVPGGRSLARADQRAWVIFNAGVEAAYQSSGALTADVASTFQIDNFDDLVVRPDGKEVPINAAIACEWTWFCSARFTTDPHANTTGYRKIGRTFYDELVEFVCDQARARAA